MLLDHSKVHPGSPLYISTAYNIQCICNCIQTLAVVFTELFCSFGLIISNLIMPLIIHDRVSWHCIQKPFVYILLILDCRADECSFVLHNLFHGPMRVQISRGRTYWVNKFLLALVDTADQLQGCVFVSVLSECPIIAEFLVQNKITFSVFKIILHFIEIYSLAPHV
jgi:hypothetical protein